MELREELLKLHITNGKYRLIVEVGQSKELIRELLNIVMEGKEPTAWRAAWVIDGADEEQPGLASDYLVRILQSLQGMKSQGALRSLLRLLSRYDIPEEEQGLLIDSCFSYLISEKFAVAIKAHSMQIIYRHVLIYPELKGELIAVLEDQYNNNSAGFKARATMLIKEMEKL